MPSVCRVQSLSDLFQSGDQSAVSQFETDPPEYYYASGATADRSDLHAASEDLRRQFLDARVAEAPARSLTVLRNVFVLPNAAIVTSSRNVIRESCFPYTGDGVGQTFSPWLSNRGTDLHATLDDPVMIDRPAVYVREHGEMGFFHWMHSVFPRVDAFSRHRLSSDYALLCKSEAPFQQDALSLARLAGVHRIEPHPSRPQFFRELIFPSPLVHEGDYWLRPPSLATFYEGLPIPARRGPKRIYVTRQDAGVRRISNEAELVARLEPLQFVTVALRDLCFRDQVALFRDCEVVVGPHGAGLSHLVSMRRGGSVLEILHPRRLWPAFRSVAARRGLHYAFALGTDRSLDEPGDTFDFAVDVDKVARLLARLGVGAPSLQMA